MGEAVANQGIGKGVKRGDDLRRRFRMCLLFDDGIKHVAIDSIRRFPGKEGWMVPCVTVAYHREQGQRCVESLSLDLCELDKNGRPRTIRFNPGRYPKVRTVWRRPTGIT